MNPLNHFLTSFTVLFLIFHKAVSLETILIFSIVFGVLIDADMLSKRLQKTLPISFFRTWVQEPFGILIIGIPIAYLLSLRNPIYFFMTIIPYFLHVSQDYLITHEVAPLAPFSKKRYQTGIFTPFPTPKHFKEKPKGISEVYYFLLNLIVLGIIYFTIGFN